MGNNLGRFPSCSANAYGLWSNEEGIILSEIWRALGNATIAPSNETVMEGHTFGEVRRHHHHVSSSSRTNTINFVAFFFFISIFTIIMIGALGSEAAGKAGATSSTTRGQCD